MSALRRSIVLLGCWIMVASGQVRPALHPAVLQHTGTTFSGDTLHVLAVMVQFPPDSDPYTTGDGKFQLTPDAEAHTDPPPHDSRYFRGKLQFVRNYFRAASHGRLTIAGTLLDSVITVARPESAYAPPLIGDDLRKLANLAAETWHIVDSVYPATPFAAYDAFVLFHAGVGRDIDLISVAGQNLTPNDIPSITFDSSGFAAAFGTPAFSGFPVGGGFRIRNTIVLPETESRTIGSGLGAQRIELGINGLFAASVGSVLGLPDLFDTRTGNSGIGTFGLMDPAGIFAFNGIFPPLPSAWERLEFGWATALDLSSDTSALRLAAVGSSAAADTILRVRVSATESYLIENRNRDVRGDGQTVHFLRSDGVLDSLHTNVDRTGFFLADVSGITGSVIDVDDFDWALPGTIDSTDATHHADGGGILLWHIDEALVAERRGTNTINADPNHRGIELVEADGSKDIGQSYGSFTAGSGSEYGSPYDCWFNGNVAPPYMNRFDGSSTPNSNSVDGAASLISISAFSARSPHMTFQLAFGAPAFKPLTGLTKQVDGLADGPVPFDADGTGGPILVAMRSRAAGRGQIFAWKQDGTNALAGGSADGLCAEVDSPSVGKDLVFTRNAASGTAYCAAVSDGVYLWRMYDGNADGQWDRLAKFPAGRVGDRSIMFLDTMLIIASSESLSVCGLDGRLLHHLGGRSWNGAGPVRLGATTIVLTASGDTLTWTDASSGNTVRQYRTGDRITGVSTGPIHRSDSTDIWVRTERGALCLSASAELIASTTRDGSGDARRSIPLLVDLEGDGQKEILNADTAGHLAAVRWNGVPADAFPLRLHAAGDSGVRNVVSFDAGGSGQADILLANVHGDFEWWKLNGGRPSVRTIAGLGNGASQLALFRYVGTSGATIGLAAGDAHGTIRAYDLQIPYAASRMLWPMYGFDAERSAAASISTGAPVPLGHELLPPDRAYNWPNPVYGSTTRFRFYVQEDATVTVRVLDLAGRLVATLSTHATGQTDNELDWNVAGIQTGIYLARIEATAGSRKAQTTVKVAVVK